MSDYDFDDGIPLPLGVKVPRHTVYANPLVRFEITDPEIRRSTEAGWPTLITGSQDGDDVGVAIEYVGQWHKEKPIEEVDVIINSDQDRLAMVAFANKEVAVEAGRYETQGYNGYELLPWSAKEDGIDIVEERLDDGITPIFYTENHPEYEAHAIQRASHYGTLESMFKLHEYSRIGPRHESLERMVIPREVRWEDKDTHLVDLANEVISDDADDE